jgi:hypothetical protein
MDLKRLFHVLVVGGSVLANKGCGDDGQGKAPADAALSQQSLPDSGPAATPDMAAADQGGLSAADAPADLPLDLASTPADTGADVDPTKGALCFCSKDRCCEAHGDGMSTVAPGFVCCWSTRCE